MDEMNGDLISVPKEEALAILYVKAQDLHGMTPTAIAELYQTAYNEIAAYFSANEGINRTWI